jgi:hypothetical protein
LAPNGPEHPRPGPGDDQAHEPRIGSVLTLPELRWAMVSLLLFLVGLAVTVAAGPAWLADGLSQAATSRVGGSRGWRGSRPFATGPLTLTC